jgi:hypothetical protein
MRKVKTTDRLLGSVQVSAGSMEKLVLGTYGQTRPLPQLCLEVEPGVDDDVSYSLNRLDKGKSYTLIYNIQNFGDHDFTVNVKDCTERVLGRPLTA